MIAINITYSRSIAPNWESYTEYMATNQRGTFELTLYQTYATLVLYVNSKRYVALSMSQEVCRKTFEQWINHSLEDLEKLHDEKYQ